MKPNFIIKAALSDNEMAYLKRRWQDSMSAFSEMTIETKDTIFKEIVEKYCEKHRHYHNLSHIYWMLEAAEKWQSQIQNPLIFDLAIWFHDIIYNPLKKDNERKSAELAIELLGSYLTASERQALYDLILSTAKHEAIINSKDNRLFIDLDMSILAANADLYETYTKAVRKEYKVYPSFLYNKGRSGILKKWLQANRLFLVEELEKAWREQVNENIKWELKKQ